MTSPQPEKTPSPKIQAEPRSDADIRKDNMITPNSHRVIPANDKVLPMYTRLPGNRRHQGKPMLATDIGSNNRPFRVNYDLSAWAERNGILMHGVEVVELTGGLGNGLMATRDVEEDAENRLLIQVPSSVILNMDYISNQAEEDDDLANVLNACYPWTATPRGAIVVFLLLQMTRADPDYDCGPDQPPGDAWTEYMSQFLDCNTAPPTQWPEGHRAGLYGTTLERLAQRKVELLSTEFNRILGCCTNIKWCETYWKNRLTFDDFRFVDTIYRSRAMELSGLGSCLVPVMDMANHDNEQNYIASYKYNEERHCAEMAVEFGRYIETGRNGTEVTINYGWNKTPADMLLSYGFVDENQPPAGIDVYIPDTFPGLTETAMKIQRVLGLPPVCHVRFESSSRVEIESYLLYASTISNDDVSFVNNESEDDIVTILFHDKPVTSAEMFLDEVRMDANADKLRLKFFASVHNFLDYIFQQREDIMLGPISESRKRPDGISDSNWKSCQILRKQELSVLKQTIWWLESKMRSDSQLFESIPISRGPPIEEISEVEQYPSNLEAKSEVSSQQPESLSHDCRRSFQTTAPDFTPYWEPYKPGANSGDGSWKSKSSKPSKTEQEDRGIDEVGDLVPSLKRMRFTEEDRMRARLKVREAHIMSKLAGE